MSSSRFHISRLSSARWLLRSESSEGAPYLPVTFKKNSLKRVESIPIASPVALSIVEKKEKSSESEAAIICVSLHYTLVHPQEKCTALIVLEGWATHDQASNELERRWSFLGDGDCIIEKQIISRSENWVYVTAAKPSYEHLWRTPHSLVTYCGDVSCEAMMQVHLTRRRDIARVGNFTWQEPFALAQFSEGVPSLGLQIQEWARRCSTLRLCCLLWLLQHRPPKEWLGALRDKL